jgi:hypothetical protein
MESWFADYVDVINWANEHPCIRGIDRTERQPIDLPPRPTPPLAQPMGVHAT